MSQNVGRLHKHNATSPGSLSHCPAWNIDGRQNSPEVCARMTYTVDNESGKNRAIIGNPLGPYKKRPLVDADAWASPLVSFGQCSG